MRTKKAVKAVVELTGDVDGVRDQPDLGGDLDGTVDEAVSGAAFSGSQLSGDDRGLQSVGGFAGGCQVLNAGEGDCQAADGAKAAHHVEEPSPNIVQTPKVGRGRRKRRKIATPGSSGGRPSKLSTPVKTMSDERKRKYDRERQAHIRNQLTTPTKKVQAAEISQSSGSRGRPSIFGVAMSPRSLNKRRISLEKKKKISNIRRMAVNKRWGKADSSSDGFEFDDEGHVIENNNIENETSEHQIEPDSDGEGNVDASRTILWRNSSEVMSFLSKFSHEEQVEILVRLVHRNDLSHILQTQEDKLRFVIVNAAKFLKFSRSCCRKVRRRVRKLIKILKKFKTPSAVVKLVFSQLLSDDRFEILFQLAGLECHESIMSRKTLVEMSMRRQAKDMLTRFDTGPEKILRAKLAVRIVEEVGLSLDIKGDAKLLSEAVSSSPGYAKKVLRAIKEGDPGKLFKRSLYHNAVKASDWPEVLRDFVLQPENSRAVPGRETISIRRGCRVPKYTLKKNKLEIIQKFVETNPACLAS